MNISSLLWIGSYILLPVLNCLRPLVLLSFFRLLVILFFNLFENNVDFAVCDILVIFLFHNILSFATLLLVNTNFRLIDTKFAFFSLNFVCLIGLTCFAVAIVDLPCNFEIYLVKNEIWLRDTSLHATNRLYASPIFLLRSVIFYQFLFEFVEHY